MNLDNAAVTVSAGIAALAVAYAAGMYHANKRPINVHQEQHNHAAPVTVTTSGDTIGPKLIGGLVVLLVIGLAAALVIQAVTTFTAALGSEVNRIGRDLERTFNPPAVPIAAPVPVAVPTVAPIQQPAPVQVEHPIEIVPERTFNILNLVVPVLAVTAIGLWVTIGVMLINRRKRKPSPAAPAQHNISAREVYGVATVTDRAQTRIER